MQIDDKSPYQPPQRLDLNPSDAPTHSPSNLPAVNVTVGECEVLDYEFLEEVDDEQLDILDDGDSPGDVFFFFVFVSLLFR